MPTNRCRECWNVEEWCTCRVLELHVHPRMKARTEDWVAWNERFPHLYAPDNVPTDAPSYSRVVVIADEDVEVGAARLINPGGDVWGPPWLAPLIEHPDAEITIRGKEVGDVIEMEFAAWMGEEPF